MELDRDTSNTDECLVTALQLFDYCGAESNGTLHVDALMDKCPPYVKTNNAEFSYLKSLLDPNHSNPEIDVARLASALNEFSGSHKTKLDLDESFNLKSGAGPQDSDSGISNDGFLILEELQTELREKSHLASQLRGQLDFADRQHEEALATLSAERDSLRSALIMVRDENTTLHNVRRDYEEACERLCGSEQALSAVRRERDALRRERDGLMEQAAMSDAEKLTLQELLSKSKEECHRINEMYASRQASLLEQNEMLKRERAELATRLQDQEDLVQQMLKEKVILEMELKDVLNRSNQTQLRLDRSIDVSYTEDQMLTALDSLNQDSRFSSDNQVLDEDAFVKALKDQELGRASNLSLFDEIRLSFCNMSRREIPDTFGNMSKSQLFEIDNGNEITLDTTNIGTQTEAAEINDNNNTECNDCTKVCLECEKLSNNLIKTQSELKESNNHVSVLRAELIQYEKVLSLLQKDLDRFNVNKVESTTQTVEKAIGSCSNCVDKAVEYTELRNRFVKLKIDLKQSQNKTSNAEKELIKTQLSLKTLQNYVDNLKVDRCTIETQTIETVPSLDNNNIDVCGDCTKRCQNCERLLDYTIKLEHEINNSNQRASDMQSDLDKYEITLTTLQNHIDEGMNRNIFLEAISKSLQDKLEVLESACDAQRKTIEAMVYETCCSESQTEPYGKCGLIIKAEFNQTGIRLICRLDIASVGTQAEVPCLECEKRTVAPRSIRRLLWEPLKCLFQGFAVLCFLFAVSALYGVTRRSRCDRELPWRWLDAQEFMDLLLRIEYVADVPM